MAAEDPTPGLDLAQLVDRLRLAGFRIDTRQYLAAHELLLAYAASGVRLEDDASRLARTLGPIFCTSPDEQEQFAREVLAWQGAPAPPRIAPPSPTGPPPRPFGTWRRIRWWVPAALAVLSLAIVGALLYVRYYVPLTVTGKVVVHQREGEVVPPGQAGGRVEFLVDGQPAPLAADGTFSIAITRARAVTVEARLAGYQSVVQELTAATAASPILTLVPPVVRETKAPVALPEGTPEATGVTFSAQSVDAEVRWQLVTAAAAGTMLVAFLVLRLAQRVRHRLALRQLPVHGDPESVTLSIPDVPVLPVGELEMNRVALSLRRPREGGVLDLDVPATVDLSVRNAGFFQPRFTARRAMPEYVVLVSRRGSGDHQARMFDAAIAHLAERDVTIDSYSFLDDPRTCSSDKTGEAYGLRDVLERHHRATLIVAAETIAAFSRRTGRLAPWIDATQAHERRVYLTPEPPDRWTERETMLEEAGFVVLPANETGWRVLATVDGPPPSDLLFPAPYTRAFPAVIGSDELRWLDRHAPDSTIVEKLLRQLKGFLGRDGLAWMSACAVYPEITWALTLRLRGSEPPGPLLPALSRLPWFRHGFMPEWLRRSLLAQMPAEDEQRVRTELERLLEELARGRGTTRSDSALHIGRWIGPIDLMRAAAPGSPLRDRVFLGFMTGARDALWLEVPRAVRTLFKRQPGVLPGTTDAVETTRASWTRWLARIRYWGALYPAGAHLAAATLIALLAVYPLSKVLAIDRVSGSPEAMWFIEVPALKSGNSQRLYLRDPFFISRTEVTVAQYRACVADGRCAARSPSASALDQPDDWPVTDVNWYQARQFCEWLEENLRASAGATGPVFDALTGRRDGTRWQVSLPSKNEWVDAAFGSVRVFAFGSRYPWGDDIDELRANYRAHTVTDGRPSPVGAFPRGMNRFGLMDMAGNVAEWTRSAYVGALGQSPDVDTARTKIDPGVPLTVIVYGGSFASDAAELASNAREVIVPPDNPDRTRGFRVVVAPLSAPSPAETPRPPQPAQQQPTAEPTPPSNRAPVIAAVSVTHAGAVLAGTSQAFSADGVSDPDGNRLTYVWSTTDTSAPMKSSGRFAIHVFDQPGTYRVTVTARDPAGLSATASTSVVVGTLDGTWDITCDGPPKEFPDFPKSFVVRIRQDGLNLSGTFEAAGLTQTFPAPAQLTNTITPPRRASFGVESAYNVFAGRDGDFYFSVELNDRLTVMTGTSQYCQKVRGTRRAPAAAR